MKDPGGPGGTNRTLREGARSGGQEEDQFGHRGSGGLEEPVGGVYDKSR